jgi:hypothetical protein
LLGEVETGLEIWWEGSDGGETGPAKEKLRAEFEDFAAAEADGEVTGIWSWWVVDADDAGGVENLAAVGAFGSRNALRAV